MTSTERTPTLARDEGGAIMVVGLFMALALIAVAWIVIGIGDAVIARDRTQEAADAAVYTNAVIHARGMNLISFLNVVMMAMCILYLFISLVDLVLSSILSLTGVQENCHSCIGREALRIIVPIPFSPCQIAGFLHPIERWVYKLDRWYLHTIYEFIAPKVFKTQSFAALIVPILGTAGGALTGTEYKTLALSFSLSLFPGGGAPSVAGLDFNGLQKVFHKIPGIMWKVKGERPTDPPYVNIFEDRRIALPVESEPAFAYCIRGARFGLQFVLNLLNDKSFAGATFYTWQQEEPLSSIVYGAEQDAGEWFRMFFCRENMVEDWEGATPPSFWQKRIYVEAANWAIIMGMGPIWVRDDTNHKFYFEGDDFWAKRVRGMFIGPKRDVQYAYNGSDWYQIWGTAVQWTPPTGAASLVSLPARLFGSKDTRPPKEDHKWFWAQAEFYFDCTDPWQSIMCNRGSATAYQMNYRARLRRVHAINVVGDLFEMFLDNALMSRVLEKNVGEPLLNKLAAKLGWKGLAIKWIQEGVLKALRTDIVKIADQRVFTGGDNTSNKVLH
jgi:hypothetical protein